MTLSDEQNPSPPGGNSPRAPSEEQSSGEASAPQPAPPPVPGAALPEDLRVSWSWPHLAVFVLFSVASMAFVQLAFSSYLMSARHLPVKRIEQVLTSNAAYVVAEQIAWFGLLMLFLWLTLAVLRQAPFWRTVGWRALPPPASLSGASWRYFLTGCFLAIFVGLAGTRIRQPQNMPIQELLKDRTGTLLVMALAVLLAPLVEETVFRGYLYPLLARRLGVPLGIVLTGLFFGMLHGVQLGWTWGLVGLLMLVGIVLTYVRARTGTVVASYFVHLGYNSMLAMSAGISSHGFRAFPPGS
jgi:membrane protease YdiL (CAAX protease family)